MMPCISPNDLELFFITDRSATQEWDWDIWVATRPTTKDSWSEPVNLGSVVNSPVFDAHLSISADGLALFFRSDREPGGEFSGDMWLTRRRTVSDPWELPIYIGPIDDSGVEDYGIAFSPDGYTLYFHSEARPGGFGGWDLWQVSLNPIVDFNGDGKVDRLDIGLLMLAWHSDNSLYDIGPTPLGDGIVDSKDLMVLAENGAILAGDANYDGVVDFFDLAELAKNWLRQQP
jgi:hypothetical protein